MFPPLRLGHAAMRLAVVLLPALGSQAATAQTQTQSAFPDADKLVRAGVAAQVHGDNQAAIDDFKKALALRPGMVDAHRNLGLVYYKLGDLANAREQFETIHTAAPRDVPAAVLLGYVYIKLGREADAIALLTPLEGGHESDMDLEYVLGFSLIQSGKDTEGIPRMEKVARVTHKADAYVIAGSALLHRGDMSDARTDLDAAMLLDASIPGLSTMAGQARYALGDMAAATTAFQAALRADPRDFNANLDLGAIRLKERNLDDARPLLELALELQPSSPIARLEVAKLNETTGRYAEAATILQELVKSEPNWMDAHWELGAVYYELDRPEDGKRERMIAQELKSQQQPEPPATK